jgi:hypothetical protein
MGFNKRYFNSDYIRGLDECNKWDDILDYLNTDVLIFTAK